MIGAKKSPPSGRMCGAGRNYNDLDNIAREAELVKSDIVEVRQLLRNPLGVHVQYVNPPRRPRYLKVIPSEYSRKGDREGVYCYRFLRAYFENTRGHLNPKASDTDLYHAAMAILSLWGTP